MTRTKVGKSIWLYKGDNWNFVLDKTATAMVVGVVEPGHTLPDGSMNNDWCNHLIVQDSEGNITDTPDYKCVVCPENTEDKVDTIQKYLCDNQADFSEIYQPNDDSVIISVSWGDWRHSHMFLRTLMGYIGYQQMAEVLTEEDGSDCYSADHYYSKVV